MIFNPYYFIRDGEIESRREKPNMGRTKKFVMNVLVESKQFNLDRRRQSRKKKMRKAIHKVEIGLKTNLKL